MLSTHMEIIQAIFLTVYVEYVLFMDYKLFNLDLIHYLIKDEDVSRFIMTKHYS